MTEEEILTISNNISEDCCKASRAELIEVVKYFRQKYDDLSNEIRAEEDEEMLKLAQFVDAHKKDFTRR